MEKIAGDRALMQTQNGRVEGWRVEHAVGYIKPEDRKDIFGEDSYNLMSH